MDYTVRINLELAGKYFSCCAEILKLNVFPILYQDETKAF